MKKPKTRVCRDCGKRSPLDATHFKRHAGRRWSLDRVCRVCHRKSVAAWDLANRDKRRARNARRRAAKRAASDPQANHEAIRSVYEDSFYAAMFMGEPYAVDHTVPLCRRGLHHPSNLRHIPARLNSVKGGRLDHEVTDPGFIEWLQQATSGGTFEQVVWVVVRGSSPRAHH